jgi:glycosyltransferase involved in cell wall biosynthesis
MKKTRVGMVLNSVGFGGVTEVAIQLLRALPRDEFAFDLCLLKRDASADPDRLARFAALDAPVHCASASGGKFEMIAGVAGWAAERKLDILHTHSFRPNIYGRLGGALRRPEGLRLLPHYHNQYDDKWGKEPELLALERHLAASSDAVIAVSRSVQEHVAERLGIDADRIEVIANGVAAPDFQFADAAGARRQLGIRDGALVFGLIGRICRQKGQDIFAEAAIAAAAEMPEAEFLVIGDIEDEAMHRRLRQRIDEADLAERIRFTGHRSDMALVYSALDCVVAPSRWEGFGLMLIEAMAAGKPVIAARAGAIPEVVAEDKTALLVPPENAAELAAAMLRLGSDAGLLRALGQAGIERQKAFSWQEAAAKLASVYRRIRP